MDKAPLSPGTAIGPYSIVNRVGAGAMGEVYLARDDRLQRNVALKRLLISGSTDATARARILSEARAAARITHQNVAAIHDVFETREDSFIVMEFVDGESLAARLRRGHLAETQVIAIGRQAAAALGAAHAAGIVHRDLKPANIQLTSAGAVKILDFGVARASRAVIASQGATTTTGALSDDPFPRGRPGTPAYMSPEQRAGERVDARSDLYSLGVVLFEMATGRRPGSNADPLDNRLSPGLVRVITHALETDPSRRFQTASELEGALSALLPSRERKWRWVAAGSILAAVLAWVAATRPWLPGSAIPAPNAPIRSIAVLPLINLSQDPRQEFFVDGMTDGLINTLGRVGALSITARTSAMAYKNSQKSVAEIAKELRVDAVLEGSAMLASGAGGERVRVAVNLIDPRTQTQIWSDTIERDLDGVLFLQSEIARTIAEQISVALTGDERRTLEATPQVNPEAYKLYLLGRQQWATRSVEGLARAIELFNGAIAKSPDYAAAYAGLADTFVLQAGDLGVIPWDHGAAKATENAEKALSLDPALAEAHTSLAFTNFFLYWNWPVAERHFQQALRLNPSYATAHHWYGNYLSDMGREDDALAEIRLAQALDPLSPIISRDVAWPLFFSGAYDQAVAQLAQTLREHPGFAPAERLLARSYAQLGRASEAISGYQTLLGRRDNARDRCELAWAYALSGDRAAAERELNVVRRNPVSRVYPYDLALVHTALGHVDDALAELQRGLDIHDPTMVNLKHDPRLRRLHGHPQYVRLLAAMGFDR